VDAQYIAFAKLGEPRRQSDIVQRDSTWTRMAADRELEPACFGQVPIVVVYN
jgi:hypothetical protein